MIFLAYPPCSTCRRAKDWLNSHGVRYEERNIKENPPTVEELRQWQARSGLPLKRFFNTSGLKYRELSLKDRLGGMSEDEQLRLLSGDGMLVKRPLLVTEKTVAVGFSQKEWAAAVETV